MCKLWLHESRFLSSPAAPGAYDAGPARIGPAVAAAGAGLQGRMRHGSPLALPAEIPARRHGCRIGIDSDTRAFRWSLARRAADDARRHLEEKPHSPDRNRTRWWIMTPPARLPAAAPRHQPRRRVDACSSARRVRRTGSGAPASSLAPGRVLTGGPRLSPDGTFLFTGRPLSRAACGPGAVSR